MFTGRVLDMTSSDLMYKLLEILERKGFILYYLKAYSTTSCYIKLDFGVCNSIRIADHKGIEKYRYTFNLMIGLDKSYEEDGRYYYSVNDFDKMVESLMREDGMDEIEAIEWIEYNTMRANPYFENSPIIMYPINKEV